MNKEIFFTLLIIPQLFGFIVFAANTNEVSKNDAAGVVSLKISAQKAMDLALAKIKGTVSKVEFEEKNSKSIWEVEVVTNDKNVFDLEVDANTGEILKQQLDTHDPKTKYGNEHEDKDDKD